jgi:4-amino-4-deoxy-L-arabinose transferase-like glycosyltransferase
MIRMPAWRNLVGRLDRFAHPRIFLAACSLGLSFTIFFIAPKTVKSTVNTDYEPQVRNLIAGRGFVDDRGSVMDRYPPVYPLLLASIRVGSASTGAPYSLSLFLVAATFIAISCLLVYDIARLVLCGPGAVGAALLFTAHPHVLYGTLKPLSETPFIVIFLAAVCCLLFTLVRKPRLSAVGMFLAGVFAGFAILIRPAALLVPIVMVVAVLVIGTARRTVRVRQAAVLLLGSLLALLPWEVFMWQRSGHIVLVSSGGVPALRDGFTFNKKGWRSRIWLPEGVQWVSEQVWSSYPRLNSVSDIASLLGEKARRRPLAVVETYLFKAGRSWYGTDSQNGRLELLNALLVFVFGVPAGVGIWRYMRGGSRQDRGGGLLLLGLTVYFWGMTTTVLSIARYMAPAIGLLSPFIPLALGDGVCGRESMETLNRDHDAVRQQRAVTPAGGN